MLGAGINMKDLYYLISFPAEEQNTTFAGKLDDYFCLFPYTIGNRGHRVEVT